MTKIISILSGKGGVGKTMLTANLGAALHKLGKDVVVMDSNLTTPNLGIHLGIPLYPTTLHDVLKGKAKINDAIYESVTGMKIIPAGISLNDLKGSDARNLPDAILGLLGSTDLILMDSAAGLGKEALASVESADHILLITTPDLPSVADALKTLTLAKELGAKPLGVVVNRIARKKHELTMNEIQNLLRDVEILAKIPEHDSVKKSISKAKPVVAFRPNSPVTWEIKKLAAKLVGAEYKDSRPWYRRMFSW